MRSLFPLTLLALGGAACPPNDGPQPPEPDAGQPTLRCLQGGAQPCSTNADCELPRFCASDGPPPGCCVLAACEVQDTCEERFLCEPGVTDFNCEDDEVCVVRGEDEGSCESGAELRSRATDCRVVPELVVGLSRSVLPLRLKVFDSEENLLPYVRESLRPTYISTLLPDSGLTLAECSSSVPCVASLDAAIGDASCSGRIVALPPNSPGTAIVVRANGSAQPAAAVTFYVRTGEIEVAETNADGVALGTLESDAVFVDAPGFKKTVIAVPGARHLVVDLEELVPQRVRVSVVPELSAASEWRGLVGGAQLDLFNISIGKALGGGVILESRDGQLPDIEVPDGFVSSYAGWAPRVEVELNASPGWWALSSGAGSLTANDLDALSQGRTSAAFNAIGLSELFGFSGRESGVVLTATRLSSATPTLVVPDATACSGERCPTEVAVSTWVESEASGYILSGIFLMDAASTSTRPTVDVPQSVLHDGLEGRDETTLLVAFDADISMERVIVDGNLASFPLTVSDVGLECLDCHLLIAADDNVRIAATPQGITYASGLLDLEGIVFVPHETVGILFADESEAVTSVGPNKAAAPVHGWTRVRE